MRSFHDDSGNEKRVLPERRLKLFFFSSGALPKMLTREAKSRDHVGNILPLGIESSIKNYVALLIKPEINKLIMASIHCIRLSN